MLRCSTNNLSCIQLAMFGRAGVCCVVSTSILYFALGVVWLSVVVLIDRAYRRLSLQVHPDKGGNHEDFLRLKKAHDVLMDPQLRQK